jgi:hypothetical protein
MGEGQNFERVRSGVMHHGRWPLYPPRLGSVHDETLWGGYFRGPGANAPIFRAPDVHLRVDLREGGLGARRRTDKRPGAPASGAGSSGPGEGTESRRRGQTTSECASAKVFSSPLERSPESTGRSKTFRGRRGDQKPSNAPSPPVSAAQRLRSVLMSAHPLEMVTPRPGGRQGGAARWAAAARARGSRSKTS